MLALRVDTTRQIRSSKGKLGMGLYVRDHIAHRRPGRKDKGCRNHEGIRSNGGLTMLFGILLTRHLTGRLA
jgi:hypothetical protein